MSRISKIVNLSLPPHINKQIDDYLQKSHQNRSEFFRSLLTSFFNSKVVDNKESNLEFDLAQILKFYWDYKTCHSIKIIPIVLAIIVNQNNKVLIGQRIEKDKWVDNLTWVFPGGEIKTLDFDQEINKIVKKETNLNIEVKNLITTRIHPDSGFKSVQIVALYFYCQAKYQKIKAMQGLKTLKWVQPLDIFKYFTTSTSDDVTKFLNILSKSCLP